MPRFLKWLIVLLAVPVLLLAAIGVTLQRWVGTDDFRDRVSQRLSASLGVPVTLGRVDVDMWPLPAVALERLRIETRPPLTLGRVEARPVWQALLQRRLEIATVIVREAVIPQQAVAAIAAALQKTGSAPGASRGTGGPDSMNFVPRRTVLDRVSWVDSQGVAITVDAQAVLDADGLPASADVKVRKGRFEGAKATLQRQGNRWALHADIGGGTVKGQVQVQPAGKAGGKLQGEFDTAGVEVAALTAPRRTLTGRLEAHTTLSADYRDPSLLAEALQTQTRFTVHNAVVHGIDLASAVKSVGLSRGGETRLDALAGHVASQGRAAQLSNLVATSGALSAHGNVALGAGGALSGRVTVDLASAAAGGAIGVPLVVGGTIDAPTVQLTRGALIGAAIGTAVAPGVGTGAGAQLGDRLGRIFGK